MPDRSPDALLRDGTLRVDVHSPGSVAADATVRRMRTGSTTTVPMTRRGTRWCADLPAEAGDLYSFTVDGIGPLVDPRAREVAMTAEGPMGVVRQTWPARSRDTARRVERASAPIVYEMHVRGFARTFDGVRQHLAYLADLGVEVIELMPVHPFDPSANYWGYMPIVWGAIHAPYAAGTDPPAELADLVDAAHRVGIDVWLDVVFNHTGESDATKPTWTLRGLDDAHAYLHDADGTYNDDAGCGNVVDVRDPEVRALVLDALQRYADLGIDGFRFDLAAILTRDGGDLARTIGDWAADTGIALVAEAWDLASYQVGDSFPDRRWMQWNDRFREDIRGFLRAEPGLVGAVMNRIAGSPDLFGNGRSRTVNYVTAHDGLTMHDLTMVTSDRHRSWDAGPDLRLQQMKNAFGFLLLSVGAAMFVMGDEFARTQHGHDNPYDNDSELTWVDWDRLPSWAGLHAHVRSLIALRKEHVAGRSSSDVRFHGSTGEPDTSPESRALAWSIGGLYVMANMSWEPAAFEVRVPGPWRLALSSNPAVTAVDEHRTIDVPARTVVVLQRPGDTGPPPSGSAA